MRLLPRSNGTDMDIKSNSFQGYGLGTSMTHDELIERIKPTPDIVTLAKVEGWLNALIAVVKMHSPVNHPEGTWCSGCDATEWYPCPTIQMIAKSIK
jgi:hypothetical protein